MTLAWDHLLTDYLAIGSLVKVFEDTLETDVGFYLMTSLVGSGKPALDEFRQRLIKLPEH